MSKKVFIVIGKKKKSTWGKRNQYKNKTGVKTNEIRFQNPT